MLMKLWLGRAPVGAGTSATGWGSCWSSTSSTASSSFSMRASGSPRGPTSVLPAMRLDGIHSAKLSSPHGNEPAVHLGRGEHERALK